MGPSLWRYSETGPVPRTTFDEGTQEAADLIEIAAAGRSVYGSVEVAFDVGDLLLPATQREHETSLKLSMWGTETVRGQRHDREQGAVLLARRRLSPACVRSTYRSCAAMDHAMSSASGIPLCQGSVFFGWAGVVCWARATAVSCRYRTSLRRRFRLRIASIGVLPSASLRW